MFSISVNQKNFNALYPSLPTKEKKRKGGKNITNKRKNNGTKNYKMKINEKI